MLTLLLLLICTAATTIGALVGAGGGVIIKPVLDMLELMPVKTASFCSGCTVLCMSLVSLLCTRTSGVKLQVKTSTPLAFGAVIGGFVGKAILEMLAKGHGSNVLGGVQAFFLALITCGVLLYVCHKDSLRSLHVQSIPLCSLIGFVLGVISSFLGIGGGTSNVAVLFYFFSMDAKEASRNSIYIIVFSQLASIATALFTHSVPAFEWIELLGMIAGGISGALISAAISRRLDTKGVEKALKALLVVMIGVNSYNLLKFFIPS